MIYPLPPCPPAHGQRAFAAPRPCSNASLGGTGQRRAGRGAAAAPRRGRGRRHDRDARRRAGGRGPGRRPGRALGPRAQLSDPAEAMRAVLVAKSGPDGARARGAVPGLLPVRRRLPQRGGRGPHQRRACARLGRRAAERRGRRDCEVCDDALDDGLFCFP